MEFDVSLCFLNLEKRSVLASTIKDLTIRLSKT
jgi:hypothetical protein